MTTILAAAQARHQQAVAGLAEATAELLACMKSIEPSFTGTVASMADRRWEARLEGPRPMWELSQAHSAWRRAQRQEAKARSAAYRAQWVRVEQPVPKPRRAPRRRPRTFAEAIAA